MTRSCSARRVVTLLSCLLAAPFLVTIALADGVRDGERALSAGRMDEALRHFEGAARQGSAEGHAGVGQVKLFQRQLDEALQAFQRAREIDPQLAVAWYGEGEVLRQKGKCEQAVPLLEKATRLDRMLPEAQLALAVCLIEMEQLQRAIAELDRGLEMKKRQWHPRFLAARGAAWMASDSLRLAALDFTRARELAPKDASVRRAIGGFYAGRGTWALAIPELQAAVALDSTDAEAQYDLARALFYEQRYDDALRVYTALIARHPRHAAARLGLGDLLFRAGAADPRRLAEAKAQLEEYVRLEPSDASGWTLLGRTAHRMGLADSALMALLEAERLGDRSPELYAALGTLHADRKEWDRARAALERSEPGPRERMMLAQIYELTGSPERADSLYRLAATDSAGKDVAFALRQRAKLRYRASEHAVAESLFALSIAADSTSGEAWFYRGLSQRQMGRHAEALHALQRAAAIDTGKADRFFWLGVQRDAAKRVEDASQAFRRSVELDSTGELASRSFRQLGYYALLQKRWGEAIRMLDRAVDLDARDPQAWLWLGQGHQNAGHRKRAVECYRRALALDPKNAGARKGLEVLGAAPDAATASGAVITDEH